MIIAALIVLGLCSGSFINALVWRLHEQGERVKKAGKKRDAKYQARLSIAKGRSMCPRCKRELLAKDLVPVISWLSLHGKCRYCQKPISFQYPLVELVTAGLFIASYTWWPMSLAGIQMFLFGLWLGMLIGLMALLVYDLRWMLLPNRLMYPVGGLAGLYALLGISMADKPLTTLLNVFLALVVGGGIFYGLFQLSGGRWIGGGDVKLGWLLGLIVATPARAFLVILLAAFGGSLVSVPLLLSGRLKRSSTIPFGPFLIIAAIVVVLFGPGLINWYQHIVLMIY